MPPCFKTASQVQPWPRRAQERHRARDSVGRTLSSYETSQIKTICPKEHVVKGSLATPRRALRQHRAPLGPRARIWACGGRRTAPARLAAASCAHRRPHTAFVQLCSFCCLVPQFIPRPQGRGARSPRTAKRARGCLAAGLLWHPRSSARQPHARLAVLHPGATAAGTRWPEGTREPYAAAR